MVPTTTGVALTIKLILCRHTQTQEDVQGIYSGQRDVLLNPTGRRQSHELALRIAELSGPPVIGVLGSDLRRAAYLATLIGDSIGQYPTLTPDLREVNIGEMTDLTKETAMVRFPDDKYHTTNPNFDFRAIGGECAKRVIHRQLCGIREGLAQLPQSGKPRRVVIVGHGSALRLLFRDHLRLIDDLHSQGEYQEVDW